MGAMKRLYGWRCSGVALTTTLRVFGGLEEPAPTKEEKAAMREAEKEAREERAAIQAVEREAAAERYRSEHPPEPPDANTGFYRCDGGYHWCGTGPHPEYRPPGLTWDRAWKQPKPDDVPWMEEKPKPPPVWAPDPKPIREAVRKAQQGRLF